jgi:hypothetical protein
MNDNRDRIDLSGEWQIIFEDDLGECFSGSVIQYWPGVDQRTITVPGIWNLEYPEKEGIGYYRKVFTLPDQWNNNFTRLHFEGVFYHSSVWVNGKFVGCHEGGFTPFYLDTSACFKPGEENEIIVRVIGLSKKAVPGGFELQFVPASKQSWHYVFSGIWGQVWIENVSGVYVNALSITPNLANREYQVDIGIENQTADITPTIIDLRTYKDDGSEVTSFHQEPTLSPGKFNFTHRFHLDDPIPWDLNNPHLYQLTLRIQNKNDETLDEITERFGMRDFTILNGEFFLNGKPIFIKGILNQPNYPKTMIVPPERGMMEREIRLIKEAGFNMLRIHISTAPPGYLDLADEAGLLVYAESPLAWIKASPRLLDHSKREMKAMITRDKNHPSIVFWGILNENRPSNAVLEDELLCYVRSLDQTRVVIDNSGGSLAIDQDYGWVDETRMLPARNSTPECVMDLHLYIGGILNEGVYNWLKNLRKGVDSMPLFESGLGFKPIIKQFDKNAVNYEGKFFISELGCGGFTDLDQTVGGFGSQTHLLDAQELEVIRNDLYKGFSERDLGRIFGSIQDLVKTSIRQQTLAIRSQIEAILQNPNISGYSLTQLADVSWEFQAGILDLWRHPKPSYYELIRLNKDTVIIIHPRSHITTPQQPVILEISVLHRSDPLDNVEIRLSILPPRGDEHLISHNVLSLHSGIKHFQNEQFFSGDKTGTYLIQMTAYFEGTQLAESTTEILVVPDYQPSKIVDEIEWFGKIPELPPSLSARSNAPGNVIVAAYPHTIREDQLRTFLERIVNREGTLIVGPISPSDQVVIEVFKYFGIDLRLKFGIGNWMGCHHWLPPELLNEPLFTNPIADEKFTGITPRYSMLENDGTVLAGAFQNGKSHKEPVGMVWYSDIELVSLGKGAVVFCQYQIFDQLTTHPMAIRILDGILRQSI